MARALDFDVWWKGIAALPLNSTTHAYFAMRRVWADQTINSASGNRSFYRWGTEDHITVALWQNWSVFEDPNSIAVFLRAAGAEVGHIKKVQWAYACEELTGVGRGFVTPDIMIQYEDEMGLGLVAIEVKRPGQAAVEGDGEKLHRYCNLPSTRGIQRRTGCFLVSEGSEAKTRDNTAGRSSIVTWEQLKCMQVSASLVGATDPLINDLIASWIDRAFSRYGIGEAISAPGPRSGSYGTADSYSAIRALSASPAIEQFLLGSECVEASWSGIQPAPPVEWLANEPTAKDVCASGYQSTADRRVCRWKLNWNQFRELMPVRQVQNRVTLPSPECGV